LAVRISQREVSNPWVVVCVLPSIVGSVEVACEGPGSASPGSAVLVCVGSGFNIGRPSHAEEGCIQPQLSSYRFRIATRYSWHSPYLEFLAVPGKFSLA
jgi:hypothetical protein